ncbi:hypothetical protein ESCNG_140044 [Neisseria gonorrhoeae]|nr:hypothetical protein ESCNG_140044 [Neisseria gonorrhoeae]
MVKTADGYKANGRVIENSAVTIIRD